MVGVGVGVVRNNQTKKKNHLIPFCMQLLEPTQVVRQNRIISKKRNAFYYLVISWIGNLLASIFNILSYHVIMREVDQHLWRNI